MAFFNEGRTPNEYLTLEDVNRGIEAAEFYLVQPVDAMRLIEDLDHRPANTSERVRRLAETPEIADPATCIFPHPVNGVRRLILGSDWRDDVLNLNLGFYN